MSGRLCSLPQRRVPHPLDDSTNHADRGQGGTSSIARRVSGSRSARFTGSDLSTGFRRSIADMLTLIASMPLPLPVVDTPNSPAPPTAAGQALILTESQAIHQSAIAAVLEALSRAFAGRWRCGSIGRGLWRRCGREPLDLDLANRGSRRRAGRALRASSRCLDRP